MFYKLILFITILIYSISNINGQYLQGTWFGNFLSHKDLRVTSELQLKLEKQIDDSVFGKSIVNYSNGDFEIHDLKGLIKKETQQLILKEISIISYKYEKDGKVILGTYFLKLTKNENQLDLEGFWESNVEDFFYNPFAKVKLTKNNTDTLTIKNDFFNENKFESDRNLKTTSEISVTASELDSISFKIYDEGVFDNDSVSIYFNKQLIIYKKEISSNPIEFQLKLDTTIKHNQVFFVAESLGIFPPCTALLIIKTRKNKYEVSLSSNLKENGTIRFLLTE